MAEISNFDSWKPIRSTDGRRRRQIRLTVFWGFIAATTAVLLYALFQPFTTPDVHLFTVSFGNSQASLQPSPERLSIVSYAGNDAAAFQDLANRIHRYDPNHPAPKIKTAEKAPDLRSLGRQLVSAAPDSGHVLILYVSASGISRRGEAYLEWSSSDPDAPPQRAPVSDLLDQVRAKPDGGNSARIKLLLLETGRRDFRVKDGIVVNEFVRLLKDAVEKTKDPTLWVLTSNSVLERSFVSHQRRRSYFSLAVTQGLAGAADRDGDGMIRVGEFYRYVAANVSENVRRATGHYLSQTPVLCWGKGGSSAQKRNTPLLPAPRRNSSGDAKQSSNTSSAKSARLLFPDVVTAAKAEMWIARNGVSDLQRSATPELPPILQSFTATSIQPASQTGTSSRPADFNGKTGTSPKTSKRTAIGKSVATASAKQTPAKTAPADAGRSAKNGNSVKVVSSPANIAERLAAAWFLRDRFTNRTSCCITPIDFAPHLWRRLETRLMQCELRFRVSGPFFATPSEEKGKPSVWSGSALALSRELDDVIRLMVLVGNRNRPASPPVTPLEREIDGYFAATKTPAVDSGTLGVAEWLAARKIQPLSATAKRTISEFDRLLLNGSHSELVAWTAKLSPDQLKFAEIRFAHRLVATTNLNWREIRIALSARRYAERIAAFAIDEWNWVGSGILQADRIRRSGERQLVDGVGTDFRQRSLRLLRTAVRRYNRVANRLQRIHTGRRLYHDLAFRAADLVRWHHATDFAPAGTGPTTQQVRQLLTTLKQLAGRLDIPSLDSESDIRRLTAMLLTIRSGLQRSLRDSVESVAARLLAKGDPLAGDPIRLDSVLQLPLIAASLRLRVLKASGRLATSSTSDVVRTTGDWHGPERRIVTNADWRILRHRAELDVLLASVTSPVDTAETPNSLDSVKNALLAVQADGRWDAHRRLGNALRELRGRLPRRIASFAATIGGKGRSRICAALRRARLLGKYRASDLNVNGLVRRRQILQAARRLTALQKRIDAAFSDAHPDETVYLTSVAARLRSDVVRVDPQRHPGNPNVPDLEIDSPKTVSLIDNPSQVVTLSIRNRSTNSKKMTVVAEYDGRLLELPSNGGKLGRLVRGVYSPIDNGRSGQPKVEAIEVERAGVHMIQFRLRRKNVHTSLPTKLILHLRSDSGIVRRDITVTLPSAKSMELVVTTPGINGPTVGRENGRPTLFPFPNRKTKFQFRLRSLRRVDRTVDVQLLIPDRIVPNVPFSDLTAAQFAKWRNGTGSLRLLAEQKGVKLPGDGSPQTLKPQAAAGAAISAKAAAKTPDGDAAPTLAMLEFGLVAVIRDKRNGRVTVFPVKFAVQRPRRYVVPRVSFDAQTRRLAIRVSQREKGWLPDGPVPVRCEISPKLPDGVEANLSGTLTADGNLSLFAFIPENLGRTVRLDIHVDEFPRAFVFQIPGDRSVASIPENVARRSVSLAVDEKHRVVSPAADSVAVSIKVDAPVGSFQHHRDAIEIGVDDDRDRKLTGDTVKRLFLDRKTVAAVEEIGEDGNLVIRSEVGDWTVDVPVKVYRNRIVNLLGRLVAGSKATWSNGITIVVDSQPPMVEPLRTLSAVEGGMLPVTITATDGNLSGIAKVEVAVDPGAGQFPKDSPPMVATPDLQGQWEAKVPLEKLTPGKYRLLIRATDRAGNTTETLKAAFVIYSKKSLATRNKPRPNRVEGSVVFDGDAISNSAVTLTPMDVKSAVKVPPVTTDKNGEFVFPAVPPGKYTLTAKKPALANKNRSVTIRLTVPELPETVPNQRVEFP